MTTVAYAYSDPLLESPPDDDRWGDDVVRVYQDLGDRLQLRQLLQDCTSADTPIDTVIVRRLDELGDTVEDVGDRLHTFQSLGVTVISLEDLPEGSPGASPEQNSLDQPPDSIQQSDEKAAALTLFRTIQQRQSARRIRLGHARNRIKALPPPGRAPYGYRRGKDRYAIDRSTAPIVKDFVEHFLLYGSLRGSVRYLARKYNKKISVSTGQRWLTSPVYRGDLAYHTGDVVPNTHLAIISRDEAAQVDRLLRRNRKLPPRTASAPRSLAGLVKCGTCQSAMKLTRTTIRGKAKEYLYLSPVACPYKKNRSNQSTASSQDGAEGHSSGSGHSFSTTALPCRSIPYDEMLDKTIQRICEDLPRAVAGADLPNLETVKQRLQQQIDANQAVIDQLPQLQASGILDDETATLRAYTLRTEIAELQTQRDQLPPVNLWAIAQTVSLPQFWLDLSEAERRFYFREFIQSIQIIRHDKNQNDHDSNQPPPSEPWTLRLVFMF